MRLIDADELLEKTECLFKDLNSTEDFMGIGYNHGVGDSIAIIKNAPTINFPIEQIKWERDIAVEQLNSIGKGLGETMNDVQPVKTGKWIEDSDPLLPPHCSACGEYALEWVETKYCPNCGARMEKEEA